MIVLKKSRKKEKWNFCFSFSFSLALLERAEQSICVVVFIRGSDDVRLTERNGLSKRRKLTLEQRKNRLSVH